MSEMANALRALNRLPLVLHKNPAGTWSFVGSVPVALGYEGPEDAIKDGLQFGMGFVRNRGVKVRVWPTKEAALAEAQRLGFTVQQVCD